MQNDKPAVFVFPIVLSVLFQAAGLVFMAIAASSDGVPRGQFMFGVSMLMFGTFLATYATNTRAWLPAPLLVVVALASLGSFVVLGAEANGWLPASVAVPARWTLVGGGVGILAATIAGWALRERVPPR